MVTLMSLTLGSQDLNLRPLGTFSFAFGLFLVGFSVGALLFGQWLTAIMCLVGTVVLLDNTFMPKEGSNESTSSSIVSDADSLILWIRIRMARLLGKLDSGSSGNQQCQRRRSNRRRSDISVSEAVRWGRKQY